MQVIRNPVVHWTYTPGYRSKLTSSEQKDSVLVQHKMRDSVPGDYDDHSCLENCTTKSASEVDTTARTGDNHSMSVQPYPAPGPQPTRLGNVKTGLLRQLLDEKPVGCAQQAFAGRQDDPVLLVRAIPT